MYRVWAVARVTLAQAVRMRVAAVIIVMLLVLLPVMSMALEGDKTLQGQLQTFASYGLSLTSVLLSILTILVSTHTVTTDLARKHIYLVASKPIRRFEILIGKLLGVVALDVLLLGTFGAIIYGLTILVPHITDAPPDQVARAEHEFFTSRVRLETPVDKEKIDRLVEESYQKLLSEDRMPEGFNEWQIRDMIRREVQSAEATIGPSRVKRWEFRNVAVRDPNEVLYVRYKLRAIPQPAEDQAVANWRLGDFRTLDTGRLTSETRPYYVSRKDALSTTLEFAAPADVVAPDGYVALEFFNDPSQNYWSIIPSEVQLLYRSGTFTGNFWRVVAMILVRLVFLAAVGVSVSTWLSFPVAILICLAVLMTGTINGFIAESIDSLGQTLGFVYKFTVKPLLWFLPKFDGDFNPTRFVVDGRTLQWLVLGRAFLTTGVVRSAALMLFGIWVFSRRELAKAST